MRTTDISALRELTFNQGKDSVIRGFLTENEMLDYKPEGGRDP